MYAHYVVVQVSTKSNSSQSGKQVTHTQRGQLPYPHCSCLCEGIIITTKWYHRCTCISTHTGQPNTHTHTRLHYNTSGCSLIRTHFEIVESHTLYLYRMKEEMRGNHLISSPTELTEHNLITKISSKCNTIHFAMAAKYFCKFHVSLLCHKKLISLKFCCTTPSSCPRGLFTKGILEHFCDYISPLR